MAYLLALVVGLVSFGIFLAAFFTPAIHRKGDFIWSGVGLFYALVLWACAGRITGGVLLGQMASVALLGWLGWEALQARWDSLPKEQQSQVKMAKAVLADRSLPELLARLPKQTMGFVMGLFGKSQDAVQRQTKTTTSPSVTAPVAGEDVTPVAESETELPESEAGSLEIVDAVDLGSEAVEATVEALEPESGTDAEKGEAPTAESDRELWVEAESDPDAESDADSKAIPELETIFEPESVPDVRAEADRFEPSPGNITLFQKLTKAFAFDRLVRQATRVSDLAQKMLSPIAKRFGQSKVASSVKAPTILDPQHPDDITVEFTEMETMEETVSVLESVPADPAAPLVQDSAANGLMADSLEAGIEAEVDDEMGFGEEVEGVADDEAIVSEQVGSGQDSAGQDSVDRAESVDSEVEERDRAHPDIPVPDENADESAEAAETTEAAIIDEAENAAIADETVAEQTSEFRADEEIETDDVATDSAASETDALEPTAEPDAAEENSINAEPESIEPDAAEENSVKAEPESAEPDSVEENSINADPESTEPDAAEENAVKADPESTEPDAAEENAVKAETDDNV